MMHAAVFDALPAYHSMVYTCVLDRPEAVAANGR